MTSDSLDATARTMTPTSITSGAYVAAAKAAEQCAGQWLHKAYARRGAIRQRYLDKADASMRLHQRFMAKARRAAETERQNLDQAIQEFM